MSAVGKHQSEFGSVHVQVLQWFQMWDQDHCKRCLLDYDHNFLSWNPILFTSLKLSLFIEHYPSVFLQNLWEFQWRFGVARMEESHIIYQLSLFPVYRYKLLFLMMEKIRLRLTWVDHKRHLDKLVLLFITRCKALIINTNAINNISQWKQQLLKQVIFARCVQEMFL